MPWPVPKTDRIYEGDIAKEAVLFWISPGQEKFQSYLQICLDFAEKMRRSLIQEEGRATCFCYCTNFPFVILPQNCKNQQYTFRYSYINLNDDFCQDKAIAGWGEYPEI